MTSIFFFSTLSEFFMPKEMNQALATSNPYPTPKFSGILENSSKNLREEFVQIKNHMDHYHNRINSRSRSNLSLIKRRIFLGKYKY